MVVAREESVMVVLINTSRKCCTGYTSFTSALVFTRVLAISSELFVAAQY